jgi:UDP-N-acetylglucosamine--N-acetylmuramyl-(pentapeptide) pyrophosphoryl-undecaprenol N-acetylglucosamine transferase
MTSPRTAHVLFAGGGTGGHLFPGLAVAQALRSAVPDLEITFCGTARPFEREQVERAGFAHVALDARPFPRGFGSLARFLRDQPRAIWAARRLLDARPAAVVGLGGYASVPVVRAAQRRGIFNVLLEQNLVPGRATRWLARRGTIVCASFEESRPFFRRRVDFRATGNPVRAEIASLAGRSGVPAPAGIRNWIGESGKRRVQYAETGAGHSALDRPSSTITRSVAHLPACGTTSPRKTLLVLGGSQGARSLNRAVPRALAPLESTSRQWRVIHQAGAADWREVEGLYQATPLSFEVAPFLDRMAAVYQAADAIVCRAGGTTLAEVACAGLPAVLVPYPHAAHDHQRRNADWYARQGAACVVPDDADPNRLSESLRRALAQVLSDEATRLGMSQGMQRASRPDATREVARVVIAGIRVRAKLTFTNLRGWHALTL